MKMEILNIPDGKVADVLHELGSELGYGNDCYWSRCFEDGWDLGYLSDEKIATVEKWLDENNISRKKEYLIHRCW